MKLLISLLLFISTASFADDQYKFCIKLDAQKLNDDAAVHAAQCEVIQNTQYDGPISWDPAVYNSVWKCSFTDPAKTDSIFFKIRKAGETLMSHSNDGSGGFSYVSYAEYVISSDEALGRFLIKGFGLPAITSSDAFQIDFWPNKPETDHPEILLNSNEGIYKIHVESLLYGGCDS